MYVWSKLVRVVLVILLLLAHLGDSICTELSNAQINRCNQWRVRCNRCNAQINKCNAQMLRNRQRTYGQWQKQNPNCEKWHRINSNQVVQLLLKNLAAVSRTEANYIHEESGSSLKMVSRRNWDNRTSAPAAAYRPDVCPTWALKWRYPWRARKTGQVVWCRRRCLPSLEDVQWSKWCTYIVRIQIFIRETCSYFLWAILFLHPASSYRFRLVY
jgi:hypothetical protein